MTKLIFIFFVVLVSLTSDAGVGLCQNLFGLTEFQKMIRELAELRYELDASLASNSTSIPLSALKKEYDKREKTILERFVKNKIPQELFYTLIGEEIESHQKRLKEGEENRAHQEDAFDSIPVDGSRIIFNSYTLNDGTAAYAVMATPTTQIVWQKIGALINSKLDSQYHLENLDPTSQNGDLFAASHISYNDIMKWIEGLNQLSQMGNPKLKEIIMDHHDGDVYLLPTSSQWDSFLHDILPRTMPLEEYMAHLSVPTENVTTKLPFEFQGQKYFRINDGHIVSARNPFSKDHIYSIFVWSVRSTIAELNVSVNTPSKADRSTGSTFRLIRQRP